MPKSSLNQPTTWESYEQGLASSAPSVGSYSTFNNASRLPTQAASGSHNVSQPQQYDGGDGLRRQRSAISLKFSSIRQAGGVNSIDNFARSWQRATGFHEITPVRRSSHVVVDADDDECYREGDAGAAEVPTGDPPGREGTPPVDGRLLGDANHDLFSRTTHMTTPLDPIYGTGYGSLASSINDSARGHAARLFQEQQLTGAQEPDKEREPLLVKQVQNEDGTLTNVVVGQSTLPQTVFNSVNTLIGVGLLSLPLALKYAGWVVGLLFFFLSAIVTSYTAKLLAICLDIDPSLITYADIAYVSFGPRARIVTGLLFSFELIAANVALVVLFADSLDALIPGWGVIEWKVVCGILLTPLNFAPLRMLSFSSILGILCCTTLVAIVTIDGIIKPHGPGSLREPATTYLFPEQWSTLPLSFGLFMSPWGGHSVFPSMYRDMRHPHKYGRSLRCTYGFSFGLDLTMAVVGLLMFGERIREEVTSNILLTEGYPHFLSVTIVVLIAIIPITKIPLRYEKSITLLVSADKVSVLAQSLARSRCSVDWILVSCRPTRAFKACRH